MLVFLFFQDARKVRWSMLQLIIIPNVFTRFDSFERISGHCHACPKDEYGQEYHMHAV